MAYKHFRFKVVSQVMLIVATCIATAYLVVTTSYYATIAILLIVLGAQTATLLKYVQKTNRDLSRFFLTIEHSDFSQTFSAERVSAPFSRLADAFERVLQRFREARSAREEQSGYLNTLVQHVPVAVIAVDETGRIDLFNHAARRLFGVNELRNLHDLVGFGSTFSRDILALEAGQQSLIKVTHKNALLQLNVSATSLRMRGRDLRIITLQDIRRELEARELVAWQNLIRVLTHEIMNSVTPISSLATTAGELLDDVRAGVAADSALRDAQDAVETIEQRSTGLLHFVENYRRLTHLPKPAMREFSVRKLFSRIKQLMASDLDIKSIVLTQAIASETPEFWGDPELLEQAIINLVKNAAHAVADVESPKIDMSAHIDSSGRPAIVISDNGHGMDEAVRENIFVPFFTTKREGTGVGLSIVQQIMRSHQGSIEVVSSPGEGTRIRLAF
jgi:nitrogen fixation/metabolism regulation signal transduction histidine kinase